MTRRLLLVTVCVEAILAVRGVRAGEEPNSMVSGPQLESRMFERRSAEVWDLVLKGLTGLGLPPDRVDKDHQVILTRWRRPGSKGLEWLPAPPMAKPYVVEQVRFEVFVSPFAEPARVYVGSILQLRRGLGQATAYNSASLNSALITAIARLVGRDGVPVPSDSAKRREQALSFLGDQADRCLREERLEPGGGSKLTEPRKIALSEFPVIYPAPALRERAAGPVMVQFLIQEDGAVVGVRSAGPSRGPQMEGAALGAASLLLYVPPGLDGCWVPAPTTYVVNFRLR